MSSLKHHYDVIVVGLGAMGSAALYQLALRGISVLGIDQFDPPHSLGSTHGETRVTRLANGEGAAYTELALRARTLWQQLEADSGEKLLVENKVLIFGDPSHLSTQYENANFLTDTLTLAKQYNIAHTLLSASEITQQYPQFKLTGKEIGYLEPTGGHLFPEKAIKHQLDMAIQSGAQKCNNTTIITIDGIINKQNNITVKTTKGSFTADKIVIAVGAWISGLPFRSPYESKIYRQIAVWFKLKDHGEHSLSKQYMPDQFPTFKWKFSEGNMTGIYGFPIIDPKNPTIKIGLEDYSAPIDVKDHHPEVPDETVRSFYKNIVQQRLPWVSGDYIKASACIYTVTQDWGFMIDYHPDNEHVILVSACSGHGFKHSPAIGEMIAHMITGESTRVDRTAFAIRQ